MRKLILCAVILLSAALVWRHVLADKATTETLGGAERYLTSVSTDKPVYKPGEKIYVRGVLLNAFDHKPLPDNNCYATVEIKGPKGDTVASGGAQSIDSAWGFAWDIPKTLPGGEYTLHITYPEAGHAPATRKFDVRAYRAPRLKSQIVFLRDGYGPGDKVTATLHTERAEGGIPAGARVNVMARVDGMEVRGEPGAIDEKGNSTVTFNLPREIPRGEGTLALIVEDGGIVETASKTIPILLQTLDLKLFPESGDLLAGHQCRVYFEARTPAQKPADIAGEIREYPVNWKENAGPAPVVGNFRTEHEGRGRFDFTPKPGCKYELAVTQPAGIKTVYPLPATKETGAIVRIDETQFAAGAPVTVRFGTTFDTGKVTLSQREVEVAAQKIDFSQRRREPGALVTLTFTPPESADGVLAVTVWDDKGVPQAERLIFRQPAAKMNVTVTPDRKFYTPGDSVSLTVKTTDGAGKPVSGVVGLVATDDSVLEMIEKREQAARLPLMVLLEPEVRELADAHVYLDAANPKAPLALDLLLGTQGWRRFALMDSAKFVAEHGDNARRVLALRIRARHEELRKMALIEEKAADKGMVPMAMAGALPPVAAAPMPQADGPGNPEAQDGAAVPADANAAIQGEPAPARERDIAHIEGKDREALQQAMQKRDQVEKKKAVWAGRARAVADSEEAQMFVVVREYAHAVRPNRQPTDRVDFAETLYWHAGIKTDATTGTATVKFALNDSVTTFRVFADAYGANGALSSTDLAIESVQPFYVEPKLPLEVTSGDEILLPIGVVNSIGSDLAGATVRAQLKGDFKLSEIPAFNLKAMDRARQIMKIKVGVLNGSEDFILQAAAGPYVDKVTRKLNVKPKGFPIENAFGGLVSAPKAAAHTVTIPDTVVPGSVTTNVAVYPTPLANMTESLQRLIQDPSGCFEQTSSTSYPLTMAQQYFLSHTGVDPKLVQSSREKLDAGYKRLVGFWCPDRGYEWFGENPGHEALTAFGLLHFTDMKEVREVDANMVDTTKSWLLKQRDGKGGFERKRRALHTWIEDRDCSNAYIVWALLESGEKSLKDEIAALKVAAQASQNSYVIALAANSLFIAGEKADAAKLMDKLVTKQTATGAVSGGTATIVGSGGEALEIETTALATLAWLRDPNYAGSVEKAMKYLADSCKGGRYGSTQSTVLALRAIVTYDKQRARPKAAGKVRVFVDGQPIGGPVAFDPKTEGAIKLPDISELLGKGEHKIEVKMEDGGEMPYSVAVNYNTLTPVSSRVCKTTIAVKLAQEQVVEGEATEASVTVTNTTKESIPTPVAIVGIPGGLEPRHDQLKELVKKGTIAAYEVIGREVVLYWRDMKADSSVDVPLSLVAAVPGTYTGPASRTYLYYTDEHKQWVDGVKVTITAK